MSPGQREHGWRWVKASGQLTKKQTVLLGQKDSHGLVQSQSSATAEWLWPSSQAAQQDLPAWGTRAAWDITPGISTLGPCPRARDSRSCHHSRLRVPHATAALALLPGVQHPQEVHVAPQSQGTVSHLAWEMIRLGWELFWLCSCNFFSSLLLFIILKSSQNFQIPFGYLSSLTSCYSLPLAEI